MRFVFDNGPLETVVEYTPINPLELCDNQWHSLLVEKVGVQGTVTVDDENPVTVSSPHTSFSAVNTNDPLYIGGVPGKTSCIILSHVHLLYYNNIYRDKNNNMTLYFNCE